MIRDEHGKQQICRNHNLPLEFLNPDKSKPDDLYICGQCFMEYHKEISIQQIKQANQSIFQQFEQQLDQNSKIWNITINSLISLREAFTKSIKIIENIIDLIKNQIQQTTNELKNMNANQKEGIQQAHESYLQTQLTNQRNIMQQIDVLKQNSSIDKLIQGLNEINLYKLNYDELSKIKIMEIQKQQDMEQVVPLNSVQQLQVKRYEYQLIPESSIKQKQDCYAIAFNQDGSIIVAGCSKIIQVFEFKNNQLKKLQSIESHDGKVNCLRFMKKSNQFISGSDDNTIKIWQVSNQNQYINIQTLEGHKNWIYCLIINSNDDLIVSGSFDKSIIFWGLVGQQWQLDQQIECSSSVYSLSFNDSNTKLISCEENHLIQVFEQQGKKKWINSQKIQVEIEGVRLCFINDDQFVFLPWKSKQLQFYKLDFQTNKFKKQSEVEVSINEQDQIGFPIKFIRSKNLLIVKNCQFVNILRRQENFAFIQKQVIEFSTGCLYGDVSEDPNFMVTWDYATKEYQVRYLKENE